MKHVVLEKFVAMSENPHVSTASGWVWYALGRRIIVVVTIIMIKTMTTIMMIIPVASAPNNNRIWWLTTIHRATLSLRDSNENGRTDRVGNVG